MTSEPNSSATYEKLREAFSAVNPVSAEEYLELVSHIFAGDDFWENKGNDHYVELMMVRSAPQGVGRAVL